MSLLLDKAILLNKLPATINFSKKPVVAIHKGVITNTPTQIVSTSYNNSTIQFQIVPSNFHTFISRKWYIQVPIQITITSPDYGQKISDGWLNGGLAALRSFPLQNMISVASLTVNNISNFTAQNQQFIAASQHINGFLQDFYTDLSGSPCMPDPAVNYNMVSNGNLNPLGKLQNSTFYQFTRGAFQPDSISVDTNTSCVLNYTIYEPIQLQMLLSSKEDYLAFTRNTQIQFNLTLSNLTQCISYNAAALGPYTNASVSLTSYGNGPVLYFNQMTGDILDQLPQTLSYPYKNISSVYNNVVGPLAPGASTTATTSNVQLQGFPNKMYLWVAKSPSTKTYTDADGFCSISNISISFNNVGGILSTASQFQLFSMSVKNGLNMNWTQFNSILGSVIVLDFAEDIGNMGSDVAPNVSNWQGNLQVQVTFKNIDSATWSAPQMNMVLLYDSMLQVGRDGMAINTNSFFDRSDVINVSRFDPAPSEPHKDSIGYGFLGDVNKFFKDSKLLSKAAKIGSTVSSAFPNPLAQGISQGLSLGSDVVSQLGYGRKKGGMMMHARDF
jgi:hypothetical protein